MPLTQSDQIDQLALALAEVQHVFPVIDKKKTATVPTKSGGSYAYAYADLADLMTAILPFLHKHGLAIVQWPSVNPDGTETLVTQLVHSSGQWMRSEMALCIQQTTPQGQGSAITYARRYALGAALGLVTEVDEDGAVATEQSGASKGRTRSAPDSGEVASEPQLKMMNAILGRMGVPQDRQTRRDFIRVKTGVIIEGSSRDVTKRTMTQIIDGLVKLQDSGYTFDPGDLAEPSVGLSGVPYDDSPF